MLPSKIRFSLLYVNVLNAQYTMMDPSWVFVSLRHPCLYSKPQDIEVAFFCLFFFVKRPNIKAHISSETTFCLKKNVKKKSVEIMGPVAG